MKFEELAPNPGAKKEARRLGRGPGSGWGKTAARGGKGQTARSGSSIRAGFEGGQTPLYRRIPKRGFKNVLAIEVTALNISSLDKFLENGIFDGKSFSQNGFVKVLSEGDVPAGLKAVKNVKLSAAAREKLSSKGVKIEE